MTEWARLAMSERARFATTRQRSASAAQVRHRSPDPSSRGTKRSMGFGTRAMDCHGAARLAMTKWALRNDGVGGPRDVRAGALRNDAAALRVRCPSPPSRTRPVIARNEAIHGLWHKSHGLPRRCAPRNDRVNALRDVRLGALRNGAAAPRVRCPSPPSQPRPVIARNEAIHGLRHKSHGLPRRCAPRNDEVGAPK
jgi:hypothetical protein